jgi:hypothetical protein
MKTQVKTHTRRGRVISSHSRKRHPVKTGLIAASAGLGLTAGALVLLRQRYLTNLAKAARNLKPAVGKPTSKERIVFTVGGFGREPSPPKQSRHLKVMLARKLDLSKKAAIIDFDTRWNIKPTGDANIESIKTPARQYLVQGKNPEAIRLAEQIAGYAKANPGKPIDIVGFSAGGMLGLDAQYILNKAGYKNVNLITLGTTNARIVPSLNPKNIHFSSKNDSVTRNSPFKNSFWDNDIRGHSYVHYFDSKKVVNRLRRHFS